MKPWKVGRARCRQCGTSKPHSEFNIGFGRSISNLCAACRPDDCLDGRLCQGCGEVRPPEAFERMMKHGNLIFRSRCKDCRLGYLKDWKQRNRQKVKMQDKRRDARLKGIESTLTDAQWEEIKSRQGFRCLACHRPEPEIDLTIDHIQPTSKGGPNTADNVQGLCLACNGRKSDTELDLRGMADIYAAQAARGGCPPKILF